MHEPVVALAVFPFAVFDWRFIGQGGLKSLEFACLGMVDDQVLVLFSKYVQVAGCVLSVCSPLHAQKIIAPITRFLAYPAASSCTAIPDVLCALYCNM